MQSEIYEACRQGDIDLVQILVQSSPDDVDINRLEPNGSTALHVSCKNGFTDIVRFLLDDSRVDRQRMNKDGQSAYQVAPTEQIRQLFCRPSSQMNQFCTDENVRSPFEIVNSTDPRYMDAYQSASPILSDLYSGVLRSHSNGWLGVFDFVKSLFGSDPHKSKYDKWLKNLKFHVEQCLIEEYLKRDSTPNFSTYSKACRCIEEFEKTKEVEYLLTLYTLDTSICQYLAQDSDRTSCLYLPISFDLYKLEKRAYQGVCYRGLRMKKIEFKKYQHAFLQKNYIRINTFCSTSTDQSVAEMFADSGQRDETINVIMNFNFEESCSTALSLFSCSVGLKCLTNFEDEQEVLLLPGTVFTIIDIKDNVQNQSKSIYLKHFNTGEEEQEMHHDRFQQFLDII